MPVCLPFSPHLFPPQMSAILLTLFQSSLCHADTGYDTSILQFPTCAAMLQTKNLFPFSSMVVLWQEQLTKPLSALSPSERGQDSPRAFYCPSVHYHSYSSGTLFSLPLGTLALPEQESAYVRSEPASILASAVFGECLGTRGTIRHLCDCVSGMPTQFPLAGSGRRVSIS